MKTTRLELGFERLLIALERDLIDATDEEIAAVASELGIEPGMKGSLALFGITRAVRLRKLSAIQLMKQSGDSGKQRSGAKDRRSAKAPRRRPKGNAPSSS